MTMPPKMVVDRLRVTVAIPKEIIPEIHSKSSRPSIINDTRAMIMEPENASFPFAQEPPSGNRDASI